MYAIHLYAAKLPPISQHYRRSLTSCKVKSRLCCMDTLLKVNPLTSSALTNLPDDIAERAIGLALKSKAEATLTSYRSRWRNFVAWCDTHELRPLPAAPTTVAGWVASSGASISTIRVTLSAVVAAHRLAQYDDPTKEEVVRAVVRGLRREQGSAQRQVAPILTETLRKMIHVCPETPGGHRDRALLLLGFAGAFRRSELAALELGDLEWRTEGLVVTLRRSKTDQSGEGRRVGIPYGSDPSTCPVRVLRSWLAWMAQEADERAPLAPSCLFPALSPSGALGAPLSGRAVAETVKRAAARAGVDSATVSGHSLRAGFATQAAMSGAAERAIARQTGHKNLQTLRKYIREGTLFRENAATKLGL